MARKEKTASSESLPQRMERLTGGSNKRRVHEAADLLYDAWEATDGDKAFALLSQAVELDPANVDAWLGLMDYEPLDDDEEIKFLRHLVALGEKNIGKKDFQESKGYFWGIFETRPYMRARMRLALRLMESGKIEESVAEHEGLLELNPNDNQGVRYELMALYLTLNNLEGANRLFQEYDEREHCAMFAWAYVLERHLNGDAGGAVQALATARKQNPHAEAYFTGLKRLPKKIPDSYSMGSPAEAMIACQTLRPAWKKHPAARAWLKSQRKT